MPALYWVLCLCCVFIVPASLTHSLSALSRITRQWLYPVSAGTVAVSFVLGFFTGSVCLYHHWLLPGFGGTIAVIFAGFPGDDLCIVLFTFPSLSGARVNFVLGSLSLNSTRLRWHSSCQLCTGILGNGLYMVVSWTLHTSLPAMLPCGYGYYAYPVTIVAALAWYCIMSIAFYVHCPWRSLFLFHLYADFWCYTYACCFSHFLPPGYKAWIPTVGFLPYCFDVFHYFILTFFLWYCTKLVSNSGMRMYLLLLSRFHCRTHVGFVLGYLTLPLALPSAAQSLLSLLGFLHVGLSTFSQLADWMVVYLP